MTVSAGSAPAIFARIELRVRFTPVTIMCFGVSSQAHNGACGLKMSVIVSASPLLNECDLVDFFKCRGAREYFRQSGFAKGRHPFLMRGTPDFRGRPSFNNHFTNVIREIEQFVNRSAATKARSVAFQTTLTFIEGTLTVLSRLKTGF